MNDRGYTGFLCFVVAALSLKTSPTVAGVQDQRETLAPPSLYGVEFIATASNGVEMNDAGDVIGTSQPDLGCGSTCLPPTETVAWVGGERIVLPPLPGFSGITVTGINSQNWMIREASQR